MISLFVTIQIKPGFRDDFVDAVLDDARGSVKDETGCFRFDVLQDATDPNRIHLYEVYRDEDALETHRKASHYLEWRATVEDWFDGDPLRVMTYTVFPSDVGWDGQKPGLLNW